MHPAHAQLNTLDFSIWAWIKCIHKCDGLRKSIGKHKRGRWKKNTLCEPLACASERRNPLARANESVSNKLHRIIYSEVPFPFTAVLNKLPAPLPLPSSSLWAHLPIQASLSSASRETWGMTVGSRRRRFQIGDVAFVQLAGTAKNSLISSLQTCLGSQF